MIKRIPVSVARDCSAFGTYPVKFKATPVIKAPIAEVNFTRRVWIENVTDSFLVPNLYSP